MERRPYPRDFARRIARHDDTALDGVRVRRFVPPAARGSGVALFLRGGSFLFGSPQTSCREVMALGRGERARSRGARASVAPRTWLPSSARGRARRVRCAGRHGHSGAELVRHARAYAGALPLSDPRVSPTHADRAGLCPCLVVVSKLELPRDDVEAFAAKLTSAGVETTVHLRETCLTTLRRLWPSTRRGRARSAPSLASFEKTSRLSAARYG